MESLPSRKGRLVSEHQSIYPQVQMRPLGWLFLTQTAAPAKLLLKHTERLYDLLAVGVLCFNFTRRARVGRRAPQQPGALNGRAPGPGPH